ncbi:Uncharacterized protein TCAP_02661 [Tolypocladium capitatum]|uniref:Uncharacterized protein n=1 Tax=Tolypocladium capitatum TaxID=45235 RepID=A0A2K3QIM4_9HYPO|nr:Uncharacterized protein TCAP_02661 [Tolypocladium capitatum]
MGSIPHRTPPPFDVRKPFSEYTRDELLWDFRTSLEGGHRHLIYLRGVRLRYMPSSVPVYILPGPQFFVFAHGLHNYIYRRWFRPYRSEIEQERFICKFITPKHLPHEGESPLQSTVDSLVSLNRAICDEVEARHPAYDEQLSSGEQLSSDDATAAYTLKRIENHRLHVLQPLFRALLIIVCCDNYRGENSKTVGRLPVFLVRTGVEDGLSTPITFEPIANKIDGYAGEARSAVRTTLETAIDFVMDLEAREATVFGLQPDPIAAWKYKDDADAFLRFWKKLRGDEPLVGPSSNFVDMEKFPVWTGDGEDQESFIMATNEQRAFRLEAVWLAESISSGDGTLLKDKDHIEGNGTQ